MSIQCIWRPTVPDSISCRENWNGFLYTFYSLCKPHARIQFLMIPCLFCSYCVLNHFHKQRKIQLNFVWCLPSACVTIHYCKALCDVKLCQIEGNGRKFSHIELSIITSSVKFSNIVCSQPQTQYLFIHYQLFSPFVVRPQQKLYAVSQDRIEKIVDVFSGKLSGLILLIPIVDKLHVGYMQFLCSSWAIWWCWF